MQLQSRNHARRRGAILTAQGLRKLNQAKSQTEIEQDFKRYTLETLSEKTGLTANTLSKVFIGSAGVDKRTLESCFRAFNLTLQTEDYLYLNPQMGELAEIRSIPHSQQLSATYLSCDSAKTPCDRRNTTQTHKRHQPQDYLQPRPPALPGGQMPMDSSLYINRPPLESLCYKAIEQPGATINIFAPKQMGKTSLLARILAHAKTLGYHTVSVSLQLADAEILQNLERLLQWFCTRVSKKLGLANAIPNRDNILASKSNASDYFEDVVLVNLDRPLVIAIDELSQLFAYPNIANEFLALLRVWSEQAKQSDADSNPWHNLRLVTVYSTEILLPVSINQSLLNAGLAIELPEFTPAQVQQLADRYGQEMTAQQTKQLIALLGGHPYRLQLAFYHLQQQTIALEQLLQDSAKSVALYADHLQQQWWNLQQYPDLLPCFTQIVMQSSPVDCEAGQGSQLQKMGLVHLQGLQASLACELFRLFLGDRTQHTPPSPMNQERCNQA